MSFEEFESKFALKPKGSPFLDWRSNLSSIILKWELDQFFDLEWRQIWRYMKSESDSRLSQRFDKSASNPSCSKSMN